MTNTTRPAFHVSCIKCGATGGVALDLTGLESFRCTECDEVFDLDSVRLFLDGWRRVIAWIESATTTDE